MAPSGRWRTSSDLQMSDLLAVEFEAVTERHRASRKGARDDGGHDSSVVLTRNAGRLGFEVVSPNRVVHPSADGVGAMTLFALVLHGRFLGEDGDHRVHIVLVARGEIHGQRWWHRRGHRWTSFGENFTLLATPKHLGPAAPLKRR